MCNSSVGVLGRCLKVGRGSSLAALKSTYGRDAVSSWSLPVQCLSLLLLSTRPCLITFPPPYAPERDADSQNKQEENKV
ncbi:hypothetical protein DPEC_G00012040 [Dallia pectoralis]|uniref:Uncharacterized protein n=1 Tax=Dallia pectoralis TaxID=75939 RepID=A0ACC2HM90_DALPE|nr:hypothetical protein DPEC_G00012040 [Dallia pectoralis]